MKRKSSEEMYPIIRQYIEGSDQLREICIRHNLNKAQFYYWHGKYQKEIGIQKGSSFVPIDIVPKGNRYSIEIQTSGGTIIRSESLLPVTFIKDLVQSGC